jgi:predicted amidohydrolase
MKLAIYQGNGKSLQVAENLDIMRRAARQAAGEGARLLILPEMFLSGYNIGEAVFALAEPADGPCAAETARIAAEAGIALLVGYPEKAGDAVYNAALLVDAGGRRLANYRKTHLFGPQEKRLFAAGNELVLADVGDFKVGILICYDVEFPEAVRALSSAGADLIAVPTALMHPWCRIARKVIPARAYESQVNVAYVNRSGVEDDLTYCGMSCIVDATGQTRVRAGEKEIGLLYADPDPAALAAARLENPILEDLRPELYAAPVTRRPAE